MVVVDLGPSASFSTRIWSTEAVWPRIKAGSASPWVGDRSAIAWLLHGHWLVRLDTTIELLKLWCAILGLNQWHTATYARANFVAARRIRFPMVPGGCFQLGIDEAPMGAGAVPLSWCAGKVGAIITVGLGWQKEEGSMR